MIEWIFFDMGSTLLDETNRVEEIIRKTAENSGINEKELHEMLKKCAKTHPYAIKMQLPGGAKWEPWPKRLDPLYPQAIPVLTELSKKYKLGIIANHGKDTAQLLKIDRFFDVICTSEAINLSKPDPRIFKFALESANCAPESAVMIGDRLDNDIYPAKKLGMKTVWIKQSFGGMTTPQADEYKPDYEVSSLEELLEIF